LRVAFIIRTSQGQD